MGPLEFIYYLGYSFKKTRTLKNRKRLPHRVVSVGNLTTGGTGKTPAVIAVAEEAKRRGFLPCILTRGYRGKAKGPCFVGRGDGALMRVDQAGDEAVLMATRLDGVPVVKGADRYEAGQFALRELMSRPSVFNPQRFLFILDDGFQHWKLCRDLDILLIDSTNPFGNERLLPSGILREPMKEMERADIIVLTKTQREADADLAENLIPEIKKYNVHAPIYSGRHRPTGLKSVSGRDMPLNVLEANPAFAFCGIGNPASFRAALAETGADVRGFRVFRDHHPYRSRDIRGIISEAQRCNADWIVTTEKDIMRLRDFDLPGSVAALGIEFEVEEAFYDRIFTED